jgi:hypothetical protein
MVYRTVFDPRMETGKQEIYIARLTAAEGGTSLLVETETGALYRVDLQRRTVLTGAVTSQ